MISAISTEAETLKIFPPQDPYQTRTGDEPLLKVNAVDRTPPRRMCRSLYCKVCGGGSRMIVAEQAAALSRRSRREIYRWIEDGSLHCYEAPDGEVWVCGSSLAERFNGLDYSTNPLI